MAYSQICSVSTLSKQTNLHGLVSKSPNEEGGFGKFSERVNIKKSIRKGRMSGISRILRKTFFKAQTRRVLEKDHRLVGFERLHIQSVVPDGDGNGRPIFFKARHVGHVDRLDRRLLPRPHPGQVSKILPGSSAGRSISVQGHAHGVECLSQDIYESSHGDFEIGKSRRDSNTCILGRLVDQGVRQGAGSSSDNQNCTNMSIRRFNNQFHQVRTDSNPADTIFGSGVRPGEGSGSASGVQSSGDGVSNFGHFSEWGSVGQEMALSHGQNGVCNVSDKFGPFTQEANTEVSANVLVAEVSRLGVLDSSRPTGQGSSQLVVSAREYSSGRSSCSIPTVVNPFYGCEFGRIRGLPRGSESGRDLVAGGSPASFQQQGVVGRGESGVVLSGSADLSAHCDLLRQHQYSGGNKQAGGTKSWSLTELAWELWELLDGIHCVARARHIPGRLNVLADCLSRGSQVIPSEWSILPQALEEIWGKWGHPEVDLFATHHNCKIQKFVSPFPHPRAWRVNAFSLDWSGMFVYAFPPWVILQEVLQKLIDDRAKMILVAPTWPSRTWFPLLLQLSVEDPVPLPMIWNLLVQPHSGIHHQNLSVLSLQAWLLSGQR